LRRERIERLWKTIALKEPDKVPIFHCGGGIIPAYSGITYYDFLYNYEKARKAIVKYLKDLQFDIPMIGAEVGASGFIFSLAFVDYPEIAPFIRNITGPYHDILGDKYTRFPGRELNVNEMLQFIGGEFMKPEEYDELIERPVEFIIGTILPRVCRNLETTSLQSMVTLTRLGIEVSRFAEFIRATSAELVELGYPDLILGGPYVPLDVIGDFLRNIKGILLDIYRYPDKVKQACTTLLKLVFKFVSSYKPSEPKLLFTPLHLNSYLSPKLYNEFYWPYLKEIIIEVNKQGMKPLVFFEGSHDAHLETILELPKGWGIAYFEQTDVRKAKNILAGHTCIMGGIPVSLLIGGTPNKIEEYIKKLMVEVKPGGGFIVATDTMLGLTSQTPIENIKAMLAAVEKYGKY
jgi:hypothetical protein